MAEPLLNHHDAIATKQIVPLPGPGFHDVPQRLARAINVSSAVLYHLKPRELEGTRLLPLNRLRLEHPHLFERYARKYEGRESLMEDRIPELDCAWSDVLFMTAATPQMIRELHEVAGFDLPELAWFEIDPESLEPDRTCVYWYRHESREDKYEPNNWSRFDSQLLPALRALPAATRRHYMESAAAGTRPFAFFRTPHVLYRGALDVNRLKVVRG